MAIQITFDSSHNVVPPTLVLTTRSGDRLGGLLYHNLVVKQAIRQSMEMSFSVNKNDYCEKNHNADLWNKIADFKLIWCKEWNCYFEINVTTNEEYTTDKEITAVSLGDAELSQINLYNIQINTEDDIARDDYEPTVLYNADNPNASLLHRIMGKVPHYTVKYVDPAVASIQRTFTFDNKSLYDAFQEIAEEMGCVFDVECRHTANGIERSISVFDLENYGNDTNILLTTDALADNINYSIDTGAVKNCFRLEGGDDLMTATIRNCNPNGSGYIWYISEELKSDMSEELVEKLEEYNERYDYFYKYYDPFDTEIKNYTGKMLIGRLMEDYGYGGNVDLLHRPLVSMSNVVNAGWDDDVYDDDGTEITATVYTCTRSNEEMTVAANFTPIVVNSSGAYVRTLSPDEMDRYAEDIIEGNHRDAQDLRLQIGSFFYGENAVQKAVDAAIRIHELQDYYYLDEGEDDLINPEVIAEFNSSIADKTEIINNYNTIVRKYQTYTDKYKEIKSPINGYPAIMEAYYNTIDFYYYLNDSLMPTVQMSDTNAQTEANKLTFQSLKNTAVQNLSTTTSVATVNSAIGAMAKAIVDTRYQIKVLDDECSFTYSEQNPTWNGKIKVTNYSDEEDTATVTLRTIIISGDYAKFIQQKLDTVLANTRTDTIADITDLFKLAESPFKAELKRYSLQRLKAFHDACQGCIDILIQQGIAAESNTQSSMYQQIYLPYYNKLGFIQAEMDVRQSELDLVSGKFDSEGGLLEYGMQTVLEKERDRIQENLDFQAYLGEDLWQEFVAYRREDTYSNTNYVSDGLGNDELFSRAMEFIETAKDEIEKSATKQHTISARLKNLLVMKEFASIVDCFEVGNWLRLKVDGKVFKLRLVDYQIDFESLESIDITFSDIVVEGTEGTAKDILNHAASMATSYNTVSRQARKGDKGSRMLDNWVDDGLALTTTKIIDTADNQEVSWDKHGLVCREYNDLTDSYSDTQLKLINKGAYITDNNWRTAKAGIGNFTFFNPAANDGEGEYQEAYGVIADTLVGNLILGKNVGIYNTMNSITMDEHGFTLTTNGTGSDEPQSVFTIRRKTMNNGVKTFKDMFYIDTNGFVTINGGVKIHIDGDNSSSTMVEMVDGKITTHITDELDGGGLIQSSISQTAAEIKNTVSSAVSKWDLSDLSYSIDLYGYGHPQFDNNLDPRDYPNKYYLDQTTGYIYYAVNGATWAKTVDEVKLITANLSSQIQITDEQIRSDVERNYETKNDATTKFTNLSSSVTQTADQIKSTVSASFDKWDTSELGYTITLYGYADRGNDHTIIESFKASEHIGEYYLGQDKGKVYLAKLDGNWWYQTQLQLKTANLHSEIIETADSIKQIVSGAVLKYDEENYTITLYGYEEPTTDKTKVASYLATDYAGKYYLNQNTGGLYLSSSGEWTYVKALTCITDNLGDSISEVINTNERLTNRVSNSITQYDLSSFAGVISEFGFGTPTASKPEASNFTNEYYLDQTTGQVYKSNGSAWSSYGSPLPAMSGSWKSEITQMSGVLSQKVGSSDVHMIIQQSPTDIKYAWNNISKYVSFENAALNIYDNTSQDVANLLMRLNSDGLSYYDYDSSATYSLQVLGTPASTGYEASNYAGKYYQNLSNNDVYLSDGVHWRKVDALGSRFNMRTDRNGAFYYYEGLQLGKIGTNTMGTDHANHSVRGLVFDLEPYAQYMTWAARDNVSDGYAIKFTYFREGVTFTSGNTYEKGFHFADNVYFRNTVNFNSASVFNGAVSFNNSIATDIQMNNHKLYLNSNSYIGLSDTETVDIVGRTDKALRLFGYDSKSISIGGSGVNINTDLIVTGTVTSGSDARLKTNVADSKVNVLSLISDIELKEYDWITDKSHSSVGIIAQQLKTVLPELVHENPETGMLSIKVDRFIPFLVKSIQELYVLCGGKKQKSKSKWVDTVLDKDKHNFVSSLSKNKPQMTKWNPPSKKQIVEEDIILLNK